MSNKLERVLHIFMGMDRSGVPVMIMNYYRNIDRSKIQFDFVVEKQNEEYFDKEISSLGGNIFRLGARANSLKFYCRFSKVLKKGNYNIVHSHMNYRNLPILVIAFLRGVRNRVSHSHNSYETKHFFGRIIRKSASFLLNFTATDLFACSILAGEFLYGKRKVKSKKVIVVNNAIDTEKFAYNPQKRNHIRKTMGLDNQIVIGHVGNFLELKNHGFLIDMFHAFRKNHDNARLLLVGSGRLLDEIKEKVRLAGLADFVIFMGSRDDVQDIYQAIDLFVLPSIAEGLSIVMLEAQTSGLKCLVSDSLSNESIITKYVKKMPLEAGPVAWAEKADKMQETESKRVSMVDILNESGFDIYKEAHKLEKLYCDMKGVYGKR